MRNLIEFLAKYHYWFLFLVLEAIALVLVFRFNSYQGSVWFTSANRLTAEVNKLYAEAIRYVELESVNKDLTQRNTVLQMENEALRSALLKAKPDTAYTAQTIQKVLSAYTLIPATVTSSSLRHTDNFIVIDKGEADGVRPEMGVVSGGGVVGIVSKTSDRYALVVPVINSKSSISCRIRGSQYFGYLKWAGGSPLVAMVTDIPRYSNPKSGVVIETSGYSSVFPPGIFVGRVMTIENSADGLAYTMKVNLGADFRRLHDVQVIATAYKPQVDTLYNSGVRDISKEE